MIASRKNTALPAGGSIWIDFGKLILAGIAIGIAVSLVLGMSVVVISAGTSNPAVSPSWYGTGVR